MATGTGQSEQQLPGRLEIRPEEHAALVDGRPLSLTMRELQLLVTLAQHPQRIMTRDELFAAVWGPDFVSTNGAGTQSTTIPSAILVAFFAWLATASIAKHGLRDDKQ
jgi:hypothetical protein